MTQPKNTTAALLAERFGEDLVPLDGEPIDGEAPPRARFVAQLHAFADWYASHPDVPVPSTIYAHVHVRDRADVDAIGEAYGVAPYTGTHCHQAFVHAELEGPAVIDVLVSYHHNSKRPL